MADIALVVFVLSCIVLLSFYLHANRNIKIKKKDSGFSQIVGKSKTKVGQQGATQKENSPKSKTNKRLLIPSEEMERVFYTKEEAQLDIDVDIQGLSSIDKLQVEDDLYLFEGKEAGFDLASGAGFEELAELSVSIQSNISDLPFTQIVGTGQTIKTVENTNLFEQLISQVENGEQKVADILDRCEAELKKSSQLPPNKDELEGVDLGVYL